MKKLKKSVLAEGETTGHAHVLDANVDVYEHDDGIKQFSLESDTTLIHEEHKPIILPKGEYCSDTVLEYDHFLEESRKVQD